MRLVFATEGKTGICAASGVEIVRRQRAGYFTDLSRMLRCNLSSLSSSSSSSSPVLDLLKQLAVVPCRS